MPTSGSSDFSQTRNEVILNALSLIGRNSVGITPSAEDISLCNRFLNMMIKAWSAKGLHLWTKEEGILYLTPYVGQYDLGDADVHFTNKDNEIVSRLTADALAAADTIDLNSVVGIEEDDNIGIVLDTNYLHWTTVDSIVGDTITLTDALPSQASESNLVYSYDLAAIKPLRVLNSRLLSGFDGGAVGSYQTELPLTMVSYQDYYNISMTTVSGTPNQAMYMPRINDGRLILWPRPTTASQRVQMTFERVIEDLDEIDDSFDFPSEWLETITWQLAFRLGTPFGKEAKAREIKMDAMLMLENLLSWDNEITSLTLQPYSLGDY